MITAKEIAAKIKGLPAIPKIVQQVLAMVQDPDFSFRELMELVRLDPGITSHVLRMCNSPFYGRVRQVSSLDEALTFLGVNPLVEIVLGSQMRGHFTSGQEGYRLRQGELWKHSMAAALFSQTLARESGYSSPAALFTSCLLHDVGKLIISEFVAQEFDAIWRLVEDEGKSFVEAERQVLGWDHPGLGGVVTKHWNFPEDISTAIAYHHKVDEAPAHKQLTALVALADVFCLSLGVGVGAAGLAVPAPGHMMKSAGIDRRLFDVLMLELKDVLDKGQDLLGLVS